MSARRRARAQNKLFYTWLRVAELRNIQAAKRIVAQRRRQKLKLARLLRPQLPLLASWEPLSKPHADAAAELGCALSDACTGLPLAAGARADAESLREAVSSCAGTVDEIEAMVGTFHATVRAGASRKDTALRLRMHALNSSVDHDFYMSIAGRHDERRAGRARADDPAGGGVPGGSDAAVEHRHRLAGGCPVVLFSGSRRRLAVAEAIPNLWMPCQIHSILSHSYFAASSTCS